MVKGSTALGLDGGREKTLNTVSRGARNENAASQRNRCDRCGKLHHL